MNRRELEAKYPGLLAWLLETDPPYDFLPRVEIEEKEGGVELIFWRAENRGDCLGGDNHWVGVNTQGEGYSISFVDYDGPSWRGEGEAPRLKLEDLV